MHAQHYLVNSPTIQNTVKPLLNSPLLIGQALLSSHLTNPRKSLPILTAKMTSIKRTRSPFRLPN